MIGPTVQLSTIPFLHPGMIGNAQVGNNVVTYLYKLMKVSFREYELRPGQSACGLTSVLCRLKAHRNTEGALRHEQNQHSTTLAAPCASPL